MLVGSYFLFKGQLFNTEKTEMPVIVGIRELSSGSEHVAVFSTTLDKKIIIDAVFLNPERGVEKNIKINIPAQGTKEIGYSDGWLLKNGDIIKITNRRYKEMTYVVVIKPEMPVSISYRKALTGPGYVAMFSSKNNKNIVVNAEITCPESGSYINKRLDIPTQGTKEIGYLEGWSFKNGDIIILTNQNYKELRRVVKIQ
jgi:hypothetical protein